MFETGLLVVNAFRPGSDRVTVTADTSVGVVVDAIVAALAWGLALEHLAVLRNAVAVALRDVVLGGDRIALSGRPGKVVTTDLDVVVGEFTELVVVHTKELSLFRGTEVETGDLVDGESDDGADYEGVGGAGDDVCELNVQLLPVVHDPSTCDGVYTVKADDVGRSEDAVEEETDHSCDTVLGEHIEGIIDLNPELDCETVSTVEPNIVCK